jgi:hypothetical protein
MEKWSLILVLFLPVFNSALFTIVLPFSGLWNPIPTTVSEILGNPLFWVGKRVSVEGYLYPPFTDENPWADLEYIDISPFKCALIDKNDAVIGLLFFYERKVSWLDLLYRPVLPEIVTGRVMMVYCWEGFRVCITVECVLFSRPEVVGQTSKIKK